MDRPVQPLARAAIAAALLCAATGAPAQLAVYKTLDPEVHVTHIDRTEAAPSAPENSSEADAPAAAPRRHFVPSRRATLVNASEAKRRLAQAELKRKLGEEPHSGERVQVAGAFAVNYRYWQRQEKLRIEVEQAQRRVNFTQRPLLTKNKNSTPLASLPER